MKKMQPVAVSKIDKKLEQYTHALKVKTLLSLISFFYSLIEVKS